MITVVASYLHFIERTPVAQGGQSFSSIHEFLCPVFCISIRFNEQRVVPRKALRRRAGLVQASSRPFFSTPKSPKVEFGGEAGHNGAVTEKTTNPSDEGITSESTQRCRCIGRQAARRQFREPLPYATSGKLRHFQRRQASGRVPRANGEPPDVVFSAACRRASRGATARLAPSIIALGFSVRFSASASAERVRQGLTVSSHNKERTTWQATGTTVKTATNTGLSQVVNSRSLPFQENSCQVIWCGKKGRKVHHWRPK